MQELEKILEKIDTKIAESMGKKREGLLEADRIIRKHMNDGWIPCSERMPTEEECENEYFWVMLKYNTSPVISKCSWTEAEDENGNDDSFSEFFIDQYPQVYTSSKDIVIAWKIVDVPEPYQPERRDNHDGE